MDDVAVDDRQEAEDKLGRVSIRNGTKAGPGWQTSPLFSTSDKFASTDLEVSKLFEQYFFGSALCVLRRSAAFPGEIPLEAGSLSPKTGRSWPNAGDVRGRSSVKNDTQAASGRLKALLLTSSVSFRSMGF